MAGRELPQDHFCPWREEAEELREKLSDLEKRLASNDGELEKMRAPLEALTRAVFGNKSEKMPSLAREIGKKPTRAETTNSTTTTSSRSPARLIGAARSPGTPRYAAS